MCACVGTSNEVVSNQESNTVLTANENRCIEDEVAHVQGQLDTDNDDNVSSSTGSTSIDMELIIYIMHAIRIHCGIKK